MDPVEIILVALAMIGGGVATTAGGIKLLRVFILAGHSRAEVNRLIAPSQVMSGQIESRSHDHHSAMLACVFLVLFATLVDRSLTAAAGAAAAAVADGAAPLRPAATPRPPAGAQWPLGGPGLPELFAAAPLQIGLPAGR